MSDHYHEFDEPVVISRACPPNCKGAADVESYNIIQSCRERLETVGFCQACRAKIEAETRQECWYELREYNDKVEDFGLDNILEELKQKWGIK